MNSTSQFNVALNLLREIGVDVRFEKLFGGGSGYCVLRGRKTLFLDDGAAMGDNLEVCLDALARAPEAESLYLPPTLREQVDQIRDRIRKG